MAILINGLKKVIEDNRLFLVIFYKKLIVKIELLNLFKIILYYRIDEPILRIL